MAEKKQAVKKLSERKDLKNGQIPQNKHVSNNKGSLFSLCIFVIVFCPKIKQNCHRNTFNSFLFLAPNIRQNARFKVKMATFGQFQVCFWTNYETESIR